MLTPDPDLPLRLAAFARLKALAQQHGDALPWSLLKEGFLYEGEPIRFASAAEGIFSSIEWFEWPSVHATTSSPRRGDLLGIQFHDQYHP